MAPVPESAGDLRWAAPDHAALLVAAVDVATADGLPYLGQLLAGSSGPGGRRLLDHLAQGTVDADYPGSRGYVLHLYHFHHPWTHRGYARSRLSAAEVVADLFADALDLWAHRRRTEAVYELGRACHPLADCFVPYHAAGVAGCGHAQYEAWLTRDQRWREWAPAAGGHYRWQAVYWLRRHHPPHALDWRSPPHWVDLAAHEAWPWFRDQLNGCAGSGGRRTGGRGQELDPGNHRPGRDGWWPARLRPGVENAFPAAASALVPAAVRYLAGFLHYFFTLAGVAPAGGPQGDGRTSRREAGGSAPKEDWS